MLRKSKRIALAAMLLVGALSAALIGCGGDGGGPAASEPDIPFGGPGGLVPGLDTVDPGGEGGGAPEGGSEDGDETGGLFDIVGTKDGENGEGDGGGGGPSGDGEEPKDATDVVDPLKDIPFEDPDVVCEPQCDGRECGPDECGSVCGFCEFGTACNDSAKCIPICDPITPCLGKDGQKKPCGPDGCGGSCGQCSPSFSCGEDGYCYESNCVPDCEGRECGPDKCGGVCGKCPGTKLCDIDVGLCVSNPCGGVTFQGACASKAEVIRCESGELLTQDCTKVNPFFGCVWNAFNQKYECGKPPDCTPDCLALGKQCGDGGCNYSCGSCFNGWTCENFTCIPQVGGACGTIPSIGTCIDNNLYFCFKPQVGDPQILVEECGSGKTCKFNAATAKMACQ